MNENKNSSAPEPNKQDKIPANEKLTPEKLETARPSEPPVSPPQKADSELPAEAVVTQGPVSDTAEPHAVPMAVLTEHPAVALPDAEAERRIRRMSRRSFVWAAAAVAGTYFGIRWLGTRTPDNGVAWPFRRVLEVNEDLSRDLFSPTRLAREFPKAMAQIPRENGSYGVAEDEEPDWKLHLVGLADMSTAEDPMADTSSDTQGDSDTSSDTEGDSQAPADKKGGSAKPPPDKKDKKGSADVSDNSSGSSDDSSGDSTDSSDADAESMAKEPAVMVGIEAIRAMPKTEIVTELKCIEGWSVIVHWGGVRLVDFMKKYPPATKSGKPFNPEHLSDLPNFVSMETPDGAYFVGLDMASALHPQTLLCYEMDGKPLPPEHGAPLRLVIPVKYGIKNIKHIGTIKFTDERPRDYWAQEGYDWYAGH